MYSETILDLAAAVPTVTTIPSPHPIPYFARIGHLGHTAQWVAFVVFLVSTIALVGLGSRHEKKNRAFHILTSIITGIAMLSYYAMATKSGSTWVYQGHKTVQGKEVALLRQVFWARYVDWALTTPLLLLDLGLLAGLPWLDIFALMFVDEAMIVTGLIAGLNARKTLAMWGWFVFSCIFLVFILYTLLWTGRKTARLQSNHVAGLYNGLSIFTIILWTAYPIVFALSDGLGIVNPNLEAVVYAVLDILAKAGFGFWLVFTHKHDGGEHAAALPDHWVEPRNHHHGGIHLPGGDD